VTLSERISVLATTRTLRHGIDLQRSINVVSGIRKRFSAMHELHHYELPLNDAPNFIVLPPSRAALVQRAGRANRSHTANRPVASVVPTDEVTPSFIADFIKANGLMPFFRRLALQMWLRDQARGVRPQPQPESLTDRIDPTMRLRPPRTMRVHLHSCAVLADDWVTYVSLMDNLLTRLHRERALQLAASRRPSVPTIVLVLLAVCRNYGHRAEPDDHSLVQHHQPTFRGVACTVS
jgi:hypothetical protein